MEPRTNQLLLERLHILEFQIPKADGSTVDLRTLYEEFSISDIGLHFNKQTPRWGTLRPFSTHAKNLEYLGDDAHPLRHGVELAHYIDEIIGSWHQNMLITDYSLSEEDEALLYFLAFFHDIGESEHSSLEEHGLKPIGDVPTGKKKDEDRVNEAAIRRHIYSTIFSDIDKTFIERAEAIIAHAPEEDDKFLHDIFEAGHNLQMYATSQRAGYVLSAGDNTINTTDAAILERIADEVPRRMAPELVRLTYWLEQLEIIPNDYRVIELDNSAGSNKHRHATVAQPALLVSG